MLIYNSKKEFVGVDATTLERIGYNSIDELNEDVVDFADLFDNKPGLVHNFKNFSWVDFILNSDNDDLKANIRCNGKIYSCLFKIDNFFLSNETDKKAYAIHLSDIQTIGDDDGSKPRQIKEKIDTAPDELPQMLQDETAEIMTLDIDEDVSAPTQAITLPDFEESAPPMVEETLALDIDDAFEDNTPLDFPDVSQDMPEPVTVSAPVKQAEVTPTVSKADIDLEVADDYIYNPEIAADELGLPSDLIDEFVGDFVVQAKKFKPEMEEAIAKEDFDNLQILSHKLKGVAANLRIEDALEVLTFINGSKDITKLRAYTNYLFVIIHKLEFGHDSEPVAEVAPVTDTPIETINNDDDDLYSFDIPLAQNDDEDLVPLQDDMIDADDDIMPLDMNFDDPIEEDKKADTFDIKATADELDMPIESLKSYITDFVDQANELKTELEDALMGKNLDTVKELATILKGVSQTLHLEKATNYLSTLQTTDDLNEAVESAKELFIFIRQL